MWSRCCCPPLTRGAAAGAAATGDPAAQPLAGPAQPLAGPASSPPAEAYGTVPEPKRTFEWESRGQPLQLLIGAANLVVKQYAALVVIALEVFYIGNMSEKKYLMSCNPYKIGWASSYFCEYSKTCVRCFPLMAMVVTIVVAARLISCQRAFYVLLRKGVLVDFDNFSPLRDPSFWILIWTLVSAFAHFIFDIARTHSDIRMLDSRGILVFYFAPVGYFLMFLYYSYDIEDLLIPLSKYWEEDPEWARKSSTDMVFVEEVRLAKAVEFEGMHFEEAESGAPEEAPRQSFRDRLGSFLASGRDPQPDYELSMWRTLETRWALKLTLDGRLQDTDSYRFRVMWRAISVVALAAMLVAFVFFGYQIYEDIIQICTPPYQRTDIPSLVVELIYFLFTGWIAWRYHKNMAHLKASGDT